MTTAETYYVSCPHCGLVLEAGRSDAGQKTRCPDCQTAFVIPPYQGPEEESPEESAPEPVPAPAPARQKESSGFWKGAGTALMLLLCFGLKIGFRACRDYDRRNRSSASQLTQAAKDSVDSAASEEFEAVLEGKDPEDAARAFLAELRRHGTVSLREERLTIDYFRDIGVMGRDSFEKGKAFGEEWSAETAILWDPEASDSLFSASSRKYTRLRRLKARLDDFERMCKESAAAIERRQERFLDDLDANAEDRSDARAEIKKAQKQNTRICRMFRRQLEIMETVADADGQMSDRHVALAEEFDSLTEQLAAFANEVD